MTTKRRYLTSVVLCAAFFLQMSCDNGKISDTDALAIEYTFEQGREGWQADFTDYPKGQEDFYEVSNAHTALPDNLNRGAKSLQITGNNHSDDLFMFFKKQVTNLKPNQSYEVLFNINLASKYPTNAAGIGGSPGSSVFLKVGASAQEPKAVLENDFWKLNMDKGNQASEGKDLKSVGHIGIPGDTFQYQLITRDNQAKPLLAKTDAEGKLWLIVGTDSGYEGTTTLYYDRIALKLTPVRGN